jgi:surface antigen
MKTHEIAGLGLTLALAACAPPLLNGPPLAPAGLPTLAPGDTLTWDGGYSETVVAVRGDEVDWRYANGATFTSHRNFLVPALKWNNSDSRATTRVAAPATLWPSAPGGVARFRTEQRVTRKISNSESVFQDEWSCRNDGVETVLVPLGQFDTFRLRCQLFYSGSILEEYVWNYAPSLGQVVRRKLPKGDQAEMLVAFSRGALPAEVSQAAERVVQRALETASSGITVEASDHDRRVAVTPIASFITEKGAVCREFRQHIEAGAVTSISAAVACRGAEGRWTVPGK